MGKINDGIETIFSERNHYIIIGLTGRTGSGCTEVAKILQTSKFSELKLHLPKELDYKSNEERKYKIIYNYAQYKMNWSPFQVLSMSNMIFTFILQHKYEELPKILESVLPELSQKEINGIMSNLDKDMRALYCTLHKAFIDCLDDKKENALKRKGVDGYLKKEYELLDEISETHNVLRKELKEHIYKYEEEFEESGKKEIRSHVANAYTYLYQQLGNNIRSHGDVFKGAFTGHNMFDLARRANDFVKAIKDHNDATDKPTLVCIDAIRNPYEGTYFKDRYSSFYLISVNTEDDERRRRLSSLNKEQIDDLDRLEYPKKLKGSDIFTNQNIGSCLELSDIHIYNPISKTEEKFFLTEQIIKYVMLMKHPGLITPTRIERCMQIAYNAKLNSGCLSRQVGATITDEKYSVKAVGWNDVPEGQVPCNLRDIKSFCINKDRKSYSQFEIEDSKFNNELKDRKEKINYDKLSGRLHPYCFKDVYNKISNTKNQVYTRALHAEENAFLQIAKNGGSGIKGGFLFTTASPCELCSKKAYQLGIKCIYYIDPYPGISIPHILNFGENNPKNPKSQLFYGAIGKAYTELYSQRFAIKDELELFNED